MEERSGRARKKIKRKTAERVTRGGRERKDKRRMK